MPTFRPAIFENMSFPPYEFKEYPKACDIPDQFVPFFREILLPSNMSNMIFSHDKDGNQLSIPSLKVPHQVLVNSPEEEEALVAKLKKLSAEQNSHSNVKPNK